MIFTTLSHFYGDCKKNNLSKISVELKKGTIFLFVVPCYDLNCRTRNPPKEAAMKKNIRVILFGELVLLILIFLLCLSNGAISSIIWFVDFPSMILIALALIPGLLIMGAWKDFLKAFSVGIRHYKLLELKNIIGAVEAAQKLTVLGALFSIITSGILLAGHLDDLTTIGPGLAVCFLSGLYAVIVEFFLLPLRLNAERKMNEEMDLGDE